MSLCSNKMTINILKKENSFIHKEYINKSKYIENCDMCSL